jgi:TolB protein
MKTFLCILSLIFFLACADTTSEKKTELPQKTKSYRLAYNVLYDSENDNYEVFSMNLDGSDKQNITNLKGVEWTYNADGKDLYVISDKDTTHRHYFLYRTTAKGNSFTKVSEVRLADSWIGTRKNGTELIVRPHSSVDTAFYILNYNGRIIDTLKVDLPYFSDPHFSPNGSQIVFRGALKPFKKDSGYLDELYIMNADGSNLKQLTTYPVNDTTAQWYNYHAGPPMWNPAENFITYQSRQNGKSSLYAVTPDGEKQWKLTENDSLQEGWHRWSPDGKWLAIEVFDEEGKQFQIQLTDWETKQSKILTDTTYRFQQAPVFVEVD